MLVDARFILALEVVPAFSSVVQALSDHLGFPSHNGPSVGPG